MVSASNTLFIPKIGIALKKLKNELRISKKAEQLAKDKLTTLKKQLEKAQMDLAKSKADADSRIEGVKTENTHMDAQSLSSSFSEQNSVDGKNDIMRVLQQKSRDLEDA